MHSLEKYKKVHNEVFVDDWLFCLRELKKPQPCLKSSSSSQQCCFYVGWSTVVARTPAKKLIRVLQSTQPMVISSRKEINILHKWLLSAKLRQKKIDIPTGTAGFISETLTVLKKLSNTLDLLCAQFSHFLETQFTN